MQSRTILPMMVVGLLVVIAALPIGLALEHRFFLPLLPVVAITVYSCGDEQRTLSDWFVFLCGLVLDVLSNGPLGYWALMYLAAHVVSNATAGSADGSWSQRLKRLAMTLSLVATLAWLVASVYYFTWAEPLPYVFGAALALAASLVIMPLLTSFHRSDRDARLTTGFARQSYGSRSHSSGP